MTQQEIKKSTDIPTPLALQIPLEKQCWNAEECAAYLKMNKKTFLNSYAPHPKFPKAFRPKRADGGRGFPLWRATEVIEWLFNQK